MYIHNLDPVIINVGPIAIHWYGLVYVLGFLLAIWWLQKYRARVGLSKDQVWDLLFYVIIGVLVGARLFLFFWEPAYYFGNPLRIFEVWNGGMSFHGGFVGSVVGAWYYCKRKKVNFWKVADVLSVPAIFALMLGRVANFINGELWGRVWDGSWCVNFVNADARAGDVCRHPSQIYGAVKRSIVFGWLFFLQLHKEFTPGFIFWNFVFWEGLGRVIVDFYRENSLFLNLSLGQWFSLAMVFVAAWVFYKRYRDDWKKLFGF